MDSSGISEQVIIFITYSQDDDNYLLRIREHLSTLGREAVYIDSDPIEAASPNSNVLYQPRITSADVILPLISSKYLASYNFYYLQSFLIQQYKFRNATILPILLKPVEKGFFSTDIGQFKIIPDNQKSITELPNKDKGLSDIAEKIREAVYEIRKTRYRDYFEKLTKHSFPLDRTTKHQLLVLTRRMRLQDQDIHAIERPILEIREKEDENYKKNLLHYEESFSEIAGDQYPLSKGVLLELNQLRESLGISASDAKKIESNIRNIRKREYQEHLEEYKEIYAAELDKAQDGNLSEAQVQFLDGEKNRLRLSGNKVVELENDIKRKKWISDFFISPKKVLGDIGNSSEGLISLLIPISILFFSTIFSFGLAYFLVSEILRQNPIFSTVSG